MTTIQELIGDFSALAPLDFAAAPGFRILVPQNSARWSWLITYKGAATPSLILTTNPTISNAQATVTGQAFPFVVNFRDHTIWATMTWYFSMVTAGELLHVEQVEYRPYGRQPAFEDMVSLAARLRGENAKIR